ncbi:glycerophosphodiester phosphodiesterase [Solimicrobium silvestre]|uniref:Glycerophosphoryl diester phosphodiesterase n=1 Tax=Solimicrobium silvestre TaxID=2099400 RepID=A0A2S9H4Z8_9BURK|nr:glycerophosphodiester phosphodiesterase [Solimicrobium silvestre]PRC95003.1 Glycerophosphoryl diester phosphodiesterase [Solimicrobium silvestre]
MWPYPKIIAHRGGGSLAPENTLAAMQCGLNRGFHAVEFDVMLTKDLVPVLLHDEKLGRTVAGQGQVSEMLAQDLFQLEAGSWFAPEFAGCRVPSYTQVLEFCAKNEIWMNVEIKPAAGFDTLTGKITGEITRDFYQKNTQFNAPLPLFSSFSLDALAAVKLAAPLIPRAVLFDQIPANWHEHLRALDAVALHTNQQHLTATLAHEIKQAGYGLSCYTVNEIARAHELLSWGVDALFTDRLDLIGADFT